MDGVRNYVVRRRNRQRSHIVWTFCCSEASSTKVSAGEVPGYYARISMTEMTSRTGIETFMHTAGRKKVARY